LPTNEQRVATKFKNNMFAKTKNKNAHTHGACQIEKKTKMQMKEQAK